MNSVYPDHSSSNTGWWWLSKGCSSTLARRPSFQDLSGKSTFQGQHVMFHQYHLGMYIFFNFLFVNVLHLQRDCVDETSSGLEMGVLEIVALPGGPESAPQTAVVLEGERLIDFLPHVSSALAGLFGSTLSIQNIGKTSLR